MRRLVLFTLTLLAILILVVPARAQSEDPPQPAPLVLTGEQGEYSLGRQMDILEDPSGELTINEVTSSGIASLFIPSSVDVPNYGYTSSVFWLRLPLRNEASLTNQWLLEANFQNLNYVDLYLPSEAGGYLVKETGALRPFDTRDFPYYHIVFELPLAYQAEQTFYIRVESGSSMTLAFTLWSPETFVVNKISDMLGVGLFYGALLIALGYHLFLLFSLREANYFYFVLFLASSILFWATYEGIADQFLWPGFSEQKLPILVITMSLFFMASLKFSDVFLEQKTRSPRLHQLFNLGIGLWGLMIAVVPFFSFGFMAEITSVLILVTPVFAALAGIYHWKQGYHPAQFYLISWLGYIIGLLTVELVRLGILPSTPLTEKFYHLGLIWLVLMWSLALANRINQLKIETEDANRKLLKSENKLSQTLEGLPIGVVVYGTERIPTYVNRRAENILANPTRGIRPDVSARRTLAEAMKYFSFRVAGSDQDYPVERNPISEAFEGKISSVDDVEADLIDRRVPLEIWANPVRDEQGNIESVVAAFQDITQRRQTQAELEEHRRHLEQLVDQRTAELSATNELLLAENTRRQRLEDILNLRLEWLILVNQVNQHITSTHDLPQAYQKFTEMIKKVLNPNDAFLAELDDQGKELKLLSHTCQDTSHPDLTGTMISLQYPGLTDWRFERGKPFIFTRSQLMDRNGPISAHYQHTPSQHFIIVPQRFDDDMIGLLGLEFLEPGRMFSSDEIAMAERIWFDIAQVREKARIAEQSENMIVVEERNRLARDLHDSVTQVLFSASLVAEVLPRIWQRDPDKALRSLEELRLLTRGALAEMRTMLLELRPTAVSKTQLEDLLAQLTEAITSRSKLPFQLYIERIPTLPQEVHTSFYRIAQESLNNVVKHAQASQVSISLSATPSILDSSEDWKGKVIMTIRDDGRGYSLQNGQTEHLGLEIMRERAAIIGASLLIDSQPGKGTEVTLVWQN